MASERACAEVRERRREWIERRQPYMRQRPARLVFIDETAVTTKMTRLRARSPPGERLVADVPVGHWRTQTFIAGLRCGALTAPWVVDLAMNREAFDIYVETQLAPTLAPGDVVILDNLAVHKSQRAAEALKARGMVRVPAALLARSQSHRDGLLKAQGSPVRRLRPHLRRPMGRRR